MVAHPCHFSKKIGIAHVYDVYTGPQGDVYYLNFVQAHAHNGVNVINVSNAIFK